MSECVRARVCVCKRGGGGGKSEKGGQTRSGKNGERGDGETDIQSGRETETETEQINNLKLQISVVTSTASRLMRTREK